MHSDEILAKEGLTEEQLKEKGLVRTCPPSTPTPYTGVIPRLSEYDSRKCEIQNQDVINANRPQEYVPAKDWYREATSQEYTFCLHNKGL